MNDPNQVGRLDMVALGALDQVVSDQQCPPVLQALYTLFRPSIKDVLERDLRIPTIEGLRR